MVKCIELGEFIYGYVRHVNTRQYSSVLGSKRKLGEEKIDLLDVPSSSSTYNLPLIQDLLSLLIHAFAGQYIACLLVCTPHTGARRSFPDLDTLKRVNLNVTETHGRYSRTY